MRARLICYGFYGLAASAARKIASLFFSSEDEDSTAIAV